MWPQLINMLSWWQWLVLAMIPPAIVALYFLKLKRKPIEVPSTYLWHKSIEDLHVNSIWQRLRRNLLLFLQLLLVLLAMLAVLRPGWRGQQLPGDRFIFLIDNSASMQASDAEPSRLDEAKRQAGLLIDQMQPGDAGMIVSFADGAHVEQMFVSDRRQLRRALEEIKPTPRGTALQEALKAASGLANPGRASYDETDIQSAEALPATMFIFSDGRFDDARDFNLGNLEPNYQPVGDPGTGNVGIVAFNVRRNENRPTEFQAFARLENFADAPADIGLELQLDGQMIDADQVSIEPRQARGVAFGLGAVDSGVLTLRATTRDPLPIDDVAWAVINPPRKADVLVVTPGDEPLELALGTQAAAELANVLIETPDFLDKPVYQQQSQLGAYDLIIYDRCAPKTMPQANTLFIGRLPPAGNWKARAAVEAPMIIDVDPSHPITQWLEMGKVLIASGTPLEPPPGGDVLIESHAGTMLAIAPRDAFEDAVLGFVLIEEAVEDGAAKRFAGTNWPTHGSFPMFVLNVLDYLGGNRQALEMASIKPGQSVKLEPAGPGKPLEVRDPNGQTTRLEPDPSGRFTFTATTSLGVYEVRSEGKTLEHFAVNLFDPRESNIATSAAIEVGFRPVEKAAAAWEVTRRELWKPLLLLALVVLTVEWYIYNRRVM